MSVLPSLLALLRPRLDPPALAWFDEALAAIEPPFDGAAFRADWSRAGRRIGSRPVAPSPEEVARLRDDGPWPFAAWGLDECGRAALLLQALHTAPEDGHPALLQSLYLRGTIRERQALLRVLAWLPDPGRFVDVAREACRTHVVSVFEALAVANPFPARHLPGPLFDQLVLKALSLRLPPARIVGLSDRLSPELANAGATAARGEGPGMVVAPAV